MTAEYHHDIIVVKTRQYIHFVMADTNVRTGSAFTLGITRVTAEKNQ